MAKKVNVELNMTPFIGLFALLVVNLLLTAVWNHFNALATDTQNTTAASEPQPDNKKEVSLSVTIMQNAVEMMEDQKPTRVDHVNGSVDVQAFIVNLKKWKLKHPKKKDVVLNTENGVTYKMLITVFDTLIGEEFPDVGVSTQ